MEYVKLGRTGLEVSRICLGCMSFGDPDSWISKWSLREDESRPLLKQAFDLGINFFDTANIYSKGGSEEILGRALKDFGKRDQTVIATKVFNKMRDEPNSGGLSRKEILTEIDYSLTRLGLDYVDLYIIHRWDYGTPIEETMEALNDVVRSGKARYIGASAMYTWQFQKAQNIAERHGWAKFVSMQNHYNLINREEEREMMPYCRDQGIAVTPYSPLASGRLVRDWSEATKRSDVDFIARQKYDASKDADKVVVERVAELAAKRGIPRINVVMAWLLQKKPVVSPIIGATKLSHITDAVDALGTTLSPEEMDFLEEPYIPHRVVGAL